MGGSTSGYLREMAKPSSIILSHKPQGSKFNNMYRDEKTGLGTLLFSQSEVVMLNSRINEQFKNGCYLLKKL